MKTAENPGLGHSCEDGEDVGGKARPSRFSKSVKTMALLALSYSLLLLSLRYVSPHIKVPELALTPQGGGFSTAMHLLLGRGGGTDFLCDYSSAYALVHHQDAYDITATLSERVGTGWSVSTANTHPPTLLPFVLPFLVTDYGGALRAWSLAMVFVLILTVRLLDVKWVIAIGVGVALATTFPGAYAIGNPVPLIGLGIAIAYRWRNNPLAAALGLALAAGPKISLLMALPFLGARRFKTLAIAAGVYATLICLPMLWQPDIWRRYLDAGVSALLGNAGRDDNASLLRLAQTYGVSPWVVVMALGILALTAAIRTRDTFWPTVWLSVAALPITWMSSLITFVPLAVWIVRRGPASSVGLILVGAGLMIGSVPAGPLPVAIVPVIIGLVYTALLLTPPLAHNEFQLPDWLSALWPRLAQDAPTKGRFV